MADASRRKSCPASLATPNSRDVDLIIAGLVDANSAGTGSGPDNNGQVLSPHVTIAMPGTSKKAYKVISLRSRAEPNGQILQIGTSDIHRRVRFGFAFSGSALIGPRDMRRAQPDFGRSKQIGGMGGNHHAGSRGQIESLAGGEIYARHGLVIAGGLCTEHRVPRKTVATREVDHQRDVAVRYRGKHEPTLEARQSARRQAMRRGDATRD